MRDYKRVYKTKHVIIFRSNIQEKYYMNKRIK